MNNISRAKDPTAKIQLAGRVYRRQGKNPIFNEHSVNVKLPLHVQVDEFVSEERDLYLFVLKRLFNTDIEVLETHGNDGTPKYVFNTKERLDRNVGMER